MLLPFDSGHWPFVEETERFLEVTTGWQKRVGALGAAGEVR